MFERKRIIPLALLILALLQLAAAAKDDRKTTFRPPKDWKWNIEYQQVVDAPGVKTAELFKRGKEWCARNFALVQDYVLIDDGAAGIFKCKGMLKSKRRSEEETVNFIMTLEVIDGRARVTCSAFRLPSAGKGGSEIPLEELLDKDGFPKDNAAEKFFIRVDERVKKLLESAKDELVR